jgi:hypothetical protein
VRWRRKKAQRFRSLVLVSKAQALSCGVGSGLAGCTACGDGGICSGRGRIIRKFGVNHSIVRGGNWHESIFGVDSRQ